MYARPDVGRTDAYMEIVSMGQEGEQHGGYVESAVNMFGSDAAAHGCIESAAGAMTPPATLSAPRVVDQNNVDVSRMAIDQGEEHLHTMRTIGEHEHDTPLILQSHVSVVET